MGLEFAVWGKSKAGDGYGGQVGDRWCAIIETRKGFTRGNHVHEVDQFTVLLSGSLKVVTYVDGEYRETVLERDRVFVTRAGVPHITVALEDSVGYEWWDGASSMSPCEGTFDEYLKTAQ